MQKEIVESQKAPAPIGPYSQAVKAGGMLYVSGQIPLDQESGNLITGNVEEETKLVMENLGFILSAAGLSFEHVVKCSIFIKDMNDFAKINEIYGSYFTNNPPARETVQVARLPKDVSVEISCIAIAQ